MPTERQARQLIWLEGLLDRAPPEMFKGSVTYPCEHPGGVVMVHVPGRGVAQRAAWIARVSAEWRLLVPVDVGKHEAMALIADGTGQRPVAPYMFTLDRPGSLRARVPDFVALARSYGAGQSSKITTYESP